MFGLETVALLLLIHGFYGVPIFIWLLKEERREKRERGVEIVPVHKRIAVTFGRFFESFASVLVALLIYLALTFVTYLLLAWSLPDNHRAAFITYEVATGSDPKDFQSDLKQLSALWLWILFMHTISWLIVPVLVATAVDAAHREWERKKAELEKSERKNYEKLLDIAKFPVKDRAAAIEKLEQAKLEAKIDATGKK